MQMDQRPYPGPPLLFHIRTNFLLILLWFTDGLAFLLIIESMLAHGVGGTVLFASEVCYNVYSFVHLTYESLFHASTQFFLPVF